MSPFTPCPCGIDCEGEMVPVRALHDLSFDHQQLVRAVLRKDPTFDFVKNEWTSDRVQQAAIKHNIAALAFNHSFGWAIEQLKAGRHVHRQGWNGKGMWLGLQVPDEGSKMSLPYIYMSTADKKLVPWLASQADMLTEDWAVDPNGPKGAA